MAYNDGDPNDQTPTEDTELDEDQDEAEEPTGDEAPETDEDGEGEETDDDGEPEEPAADEATGDDDELPDDPKALKHIIKLQQRQFSQTQQRQAAPQSTATDEEPDPLMQAVGAVIKDKQYPVELRRVIYGLTQRLAETDNEARRAARSVDDVKHKAAELDIDIKYREGARAISKQYGVPIKVAEVLYKGQLYEQLLARKAAKRAGGVRPAAKAASDDAPVSTRRTGSAKHTFTRPVRSGSDSPVGGGGKTVRIAGVDIPLKFKGSTEYSRFMDSLPSDAHRAVVLKARRLGKAANIEG